MPITQGQMEAGFRNLDSLEGKSERDRIRVLAKLDREANRECEGKSRTRGEGFSEG